VRRGPGHHDLNHERGAAVDHERGAAVDHERGTAVDHIALLK